jgi:hypothetical protein
MRTFKNHLAVLQQSEHTASKIALPWKMNGELMQIFGLISLRSMPTGADKILALKFFH